MVAPHACVNKLGAAWLLLMMLGATIIWRPHATWHTPPMSPPTSYHYIGKKQRKH
jgi:hypothetical protein